MADSSRVNPNDVWGPNEYAGQAVEGRLAGPIGVPLESGGLTVDRARINKTGNVLDKNQTQAHPLGTPGSTGY